MKVTIKAIAEKAGVSSATVSRALTGSHMVNEQTRERIMQIAREMNYQGTGSLLRSRQSRGRAVGVMIPSLLGTFFTGVIGNIDNTLRSHGYDIFINCSNRQADTEADRARALIENGVHGLIVAPSSKESAYEIHELAAGIPHVFFDAALEDPNIDFVSTDDVRASYVATEYLLQLGHKKIYFVGGSEETLAISARMQGFRRCIKEHGMSLQENKIIASSVSQFGGYTAAMSLIQTQTLPTAIIAANDNVAIGIFEALSSKGYKVPDDVSLLGYDNSDISGYSFINLTSMSQAHHEIGQRLAKIILRKMNGTIPLGAAQHVYLESSLVIRGSCRNVNHRENY
ncbi:MAG: LacI family DNA-binding transcriptional regulator [Christensenellales bacterium]|jgi:LacI family transcriptional regulator